MGCLAACFADMVIEWSGQQQLLFLLKSIPVGAVVALIFSGISAIDRKRKFTWRLFIVDVLSSILFAVITFFAALAIMDGHLHPLLFGGIIIGFSLVRFLCGRYIVYVVRLFAGGGSATVSFVKHVLIKRFLGRSNAQNHLSETRM